ncbi:FGGY-family carbohydrate kinase [Pseudanabaena sp. FACHB-1998]|uniref:FGGY-family carbohydrate kinase n=1 Tax=Pseudanabaena sp. FACHB-1998 TaxID=2692858 RepID=UPI001680DFA6|nr:FGGY-family carbohydrate kinase [Pseudanabaena sp. FACHB-1998]MBD2175795.1 FGGY-family carbohydrate kinase [Pseudanabaena sp. FACHB-1998]
MNYFLGIDFGTSGVRAIAIDRHLEIRALSRCDYNIRDCETWKLALDEVIISLPSQIRQNIKKIVIDGTSSTVLMSDRFGEVITPPLIYSDSCKPEILERVKKIAPLDHFVGSSTSSFAKLISLLDREEVNLAQLISSSNSLYFLHQADWLSYLLHGRLGISDFHNVLKLGYDMTNLIYPDWLKNWAKKNPALVLPEIFAPSTNLGRIQQEMAAKFELPVDCAIGAGTTDSNAAFLAAVGKAKPEIGTAVTSLGSSMVLKVLSDRPVNNAHYGIYSHRFEHPDLGCLWLVGGASNVGGAVLKQFFTDEQLQAFSDRINPNIPSPLDYYPLTKSGDRFPINDPHLAPRLEPRPDDPVEFLHGLLESMARIEAQGYTLLAQLGASPVHHLYTAGGGAKNLVWTKIRDRLLNQQLQISMQQAPQTEAAYGAALLASVNNPNP